MFDNVPGDSRERHDTGREIVIDPELVVRDSTESPKADKILRSGLP